MPSISVEIRSNRFKEAAAKARGGIQLGVNNAARRIVAQAQAQAPRKTGAMADTTHVASSGGGRAEVVAPQPYSSFQNWGTVKNPATYWFSSAVDAERERFQAEFADLFDDLG